VIAAIMDSSTKREIRFHSGVVSESASLKMPSRRPRSIEDVVQGNRRVDLPQLRVVAAAEKCERCDERAGAHARDDVELRAGTGIGPSDEETRAESAVVAAAGDCEKTGGRKERVRRESQGLSLPLERALALGDKFVPLQSREEPGIGEPERLGPGNIRGQVRTATFPGRRSPR
jgi:hypothetical protein